MGFPPKSSSLIGFSIIFTIHFGVPLFLETPKWWFRLLVFFDIWGSLYEKGLGFLGVARFEPQTISLPIVEWRKIEQKSSRGFVQDSPVAKKWMLHVILAGFSRKIAFLEAGWVDPMYNSMIMRSWPYWDAEWKRDLHQLEGYVLDLQNTQDASPAGWRSTSLNSGILCLPRASIVRWGSPDPLGLLNHHYLSLELTLRVCTVSKNWIWWPGR